jgi:hypothetical protein
MQATARAAAVENARLQLSGSGTRRRCTAHSALAEAPAGWRKPLSHIEFSPDRGLAQLFPEVMQQVQRTHTAAP